MKLFMFRVHGRELPVCACTVGEAFKRATRLYKVLEMDVLEELYQAWNVARNDYWQAPTAANEAVMDEALRMYLRHREGNVPAYIPNGYSGYPSAPEVVSDVFRTPLSCGFETSPVYSFVE